MKSSLCIMLTVACVGGVHAQEEVRRADRAVAPEAIVDVRSLVLQQLEESRIDHRAGERSVVGPDVDVEILVLAFVIALVNTVGLLFFIIRRGHRLQGPTPPAPAPAAPKRSTVRKDNAVDALLHQAHLILLEKRIEQLSRPAAMRGAVEPHVSLARTFGRGTGEVTLAQKLAGGKERCSWESRVREMQTSGEPTEVAARKFGVGTGELRLAHALRVLREQQQLRSGS